MTNKLSISLFFRFGIWLAIQYWSIATQLIMLIFAWALTGDTHIYARNFGCALFGVLIHNLALIPKVTTYF